MFHVEKMGVDDFPFAVQLANLMNWNMTPDDFKFMVELEPEGCFVLLNAQERVGIATSISFEKTGWFGNFIIKEDARRKGAGGLLMQHAIDYLKKKDVETIGLYAYPQLVKFYRRFGFESDLDFLVLKGKATFSATQGKQQAAKREDVCRVIDFDCQCFGDNRKKLLAPVLLNKGNLCYISTEKNEIIGYAVAKVYHKIAEVGPLICHVNRTKEAVMLLKVLLSRLNGTEVFTCIPKKETELLKVLHQAGLEEDFRVMRMFFGSAFIKNCIYVAESLERG